MVENPGGITQAMRDRAKESMKQAHAAYEELTDYVNIAMNAWTSGTPSNSTDARFKDVQDRAAPWISRRLMRSQLSHLQARFATHRPLKSFLRLKNSLPKTGSKPS
jgi:hypothetical protein